MQIIPGQATDSFGSIDNFTIEVDQGAHRVSARRVILATGLVDDLPAIPGVWAAGNAAQPMTMLMESAASGVTTGSAIHGELGFADLHETIQDRRHAQ